MISAIKSGLDILNAIANPIRNALCRWCCAPIIAKLEKTITNLEMNNAALQAANTSLQAANTSLQAANTSLQAANTELQSSSLRAQDTTARLQDTITEQQKMITTQQSSILEKEKEILELEKWDMKAERYELRELPPGVFVRALKEPTDNGEPAHYICADCYNRQIKSLLHATDKIDGQTFYSCHSCGTVFKTGHYVPTPEVPAEINYDVLKGY